MRHVLFVVVLISSQLFAETQPAQTQAAQQPAATAATTTAATPTVEDNTPLESRPHIGVIGGVNLANFGRDITGSTMRFGFMGGLFIEIPVAENLYLTPNLWYLQKGYSDSGFTVTVDYLDLPVNILWKKPLGTTTKLRIFAGPQVGYLLIKNQTGTVASGIGSDPGLKAIDFGINGGLGVEMTFGKLAFLLEARYQYGLANVNDTGSLTTRNNAQAYSTNGILVNLGAYWPL